MINPKVSIITASYNSNETIESCIESVINQKYKNIEHIVIDGDSKDGAKKSIEKYKDHLATAIIEKDEGIYHAMNKGIALSTGDYIGFLNSDDYFADKNAISSIVDFISIDGLDGCYGNICYVEKTNPEKIIRNWKSSKYKVGMFSKGWAPPHPTFYVRREFYESYGYFNLNYNIAADFDLMLRFLEINRLNIKYLDKNLVNMRLGGISNSSLKNIIKQNIEIIKAIKDNNIFFNPFLFIYKKIENRISQYIRN